MKIQYIIDGTGFIERAQPIESEFTPKHIEVHVPAGMPNSQAARLLRRLADEVEAEMLQHAIG